MGHKNSGLWIFYLGLVMFGCESLTEWPLEVEEREQLVVDAILTDEMTTQEVRLSKTFTDLNTAPAPVENAVVIVTANETRYFFLPTFRDPGLYQSISQFAVLDNLDYHLQISWEGEVFEATSELSEVAPITKITFDPFGQSDSLTVNPSFAPLFNPNQQAMYEVNLDWSNLTELGPNQARLLYYTFKTVDISELARPPQDTIPFPQGTRVEVVKYGLNDEFANYLKSLAIETIWKGGLFYGASANLPTNISNNGLGFFSTCAILRDTVVAK